MSLAEPQIPEQTPSQEQTPPPAAVQPPLQAQPQPRRGFSGKQVVGIIVGVLILLAVGLAIGGAIGYRLGTVEGAQQALANRPAAQLPSLDQQTPRGFDLPFDQQLPFGEALPAIKPGGPYLGVAFQMITPEVAAQEGITGTTGALLREVAADGPAAQAGLQAGEVVIAVNGQPVADQHDLRSRVAAFQPNEEITLTIVQGTANGPIDQRDVKVKLGERPVEQSFNFEMPFDNNGQPVLPFGDNGLPQLPDRLPAADGAYLGIEYEITTTGALIKSVVADSPAAKAGLQAGEVISAVDGQALNETNNLRDVVVNHQAGDEITLTIISGTGDRRDVKVVLAARPVQQEFQMPPGFQPGAPGLDSREG
jgi:S1-C subfamily serine protease